MHRTVRNKIR